MEIKQFFSKFKWFFIFGVSLFAITVGSTNVPVSIKRDNKVTPPSITDDGTHPSSTENEVVSVANSSVFPNSSTVETTPAENPIIRSISSGANDYRQLESIVDSNKDHISSAIAYLLNQNTDKIKELLLLINRIEKIDSDELKSAMNQTVFFESESLTEIQKGIWTAKMDNVYDEQFIETVAKNLKKLKENCRTPFISEDGTGIGAYFQSRFDFEKFLIKQFAGKTSEDDFEKTVWYNYLLERASNRIDAWDFLNLIAKKLGSNDKILSKLSKLWDKIDVGDIMFETGVIENVLIRNYIANKKWKGLSDNEQKAFADEIKRKSHLSQNRLKVLRLFFPLLTNENALIEACESCCVDVPPQCWRIEDLKKLDGDEFKKQSMETFNFFCQLEDDQNIKELAELCSKRQFPPIALFPTILISISFHQVKTILWNITRKLLLDVWNFFNFLLTKNFVGSSLGKLTVESC